MAYRIILTFETFSQEIGKNTETFWHFKHFTKKWEKTSKHFDISNIFPRNVNKNTEIFCYFRHFSNSTKVPHSYHIPNRNSYANLCSIPNPNLYIIPSPKPCSIPNLDMYLIPSPKPCSIPNPAIYPIPNPKVCLIPNPNPCPILNPNPRAQKC